MLTREQLLKPVELKNGTANIEALGGSVGIRQLSTTEKMRRVIIWSSKSEANRSRVFARWIVVCLTDADGARLLEDEDIDVVAGWPAPLAERVHAEIMRYNEYDEESLGKKSDDSDDNQNGSPISE